MSRALLFNQPPTSGPLSGGVTSKRPSNEGSGGPAVPEAGPIPVGRRVQRTSSMTAVGERGGRGLTRLGSVTLRESEVESADSLTPGPRAGSFTGGMRRDLARSGSSTVRHSGPRDLMRSTSTNRASLGSFNVNPR